MKLMILDGNSIVNRAYYGVRPLSAPDGTPTNAVFGFLNIFNRIYNDIQPDSVCVCFDVHQPTFRHLACESYKATRKPMPDDLKTQMPILKKVLTAMNIKMYEMGGYEADDLIGTISSLCAKNRNDQCVVVTGDKDSLQLVSDNTTVCIIKTRLGQTETVFYTPDVFINEYGFNPTAMVDLKALMGDSSDNISGVPGIGEKTALELLKKYQSIDRIYSDLENIDIKQSVKNKLINGKESAMQSFWLATIFCDVPLSFSPDNNRWSMNSFKPELYSVLSGLGFLKLIEKWGLSSSQSEINNTNIIPLQRIILKGTDDEFFKLKKAVDNVGFISVSLLGQDYIEISDGVTVYEIDRLNCFTSFDSILSLIFGKTEIITHGAKKLIHFLIDKNLPCDKIVFDTELAAYLISSIDNDYSLKHLCATYLNTELDGAEAIYSLYKPVKEKLNSLGLADLFNNIELPLCEVLAEMV